MPHDETVLSIARKIRALRQRKKLTLQQLAERTKLTKGLISKIENSRTVPSLPVFVELVKALEVPLNVFFEDINFKSNDEGASVDADTTP